MRPPVVALLALCAAVPLLDWYVSCQFPEEHGYTASQVAALEAMLGKPDDLLARGRANAKAKHVSRPMTKAEAGRVLAAMGM